MLLPSEFTHQDRCPLMAGSGTAHLRTSDSVLRAEHLVVEHRAGTRGTVHAVSDVSFDIVSGETLGLVGESGCGKSTTGRALMMLPTPTGGSVQFQSIELTELRGKTLRQARARMQMVFQDPISSLNPRLTVRSIVEEGLSISRAPRPWTDRVDQLLDEVGLDPSAVADRRPSQLSGGQCQRVAIARALVLEPALLICDEAVSALDVSVQAQILNLLEDLKDRHALTMLFIAHDLGVVRNVSDRVAVMYLGKLCEIGPTTEIWERPQHPYTQSLLEAVPVTDPDRRPGPGRLRGDPPSPIAPPPGCRFHTRCERASQLCQIEEPMMRELAPGHHTACHHPGPPEAVAVSSLSQTADRSVP